MNIDQIDVRSRIIDVIYRLIILPSKMGMNYAEDPINMGMFYNSRCHSKWVCFQILNTHIRAFLYWSCPPPPVRYIPLCVASEIAVRYGHSLVTLRAFRDCCYCLRFSRAISTMKSERHCCIPLAHLFIVIVLQKRLQT